MSSCNRGRLGTQHSKKKKRRGFLRRGDGRSRMNCTEGTTTPRRALREGGTGAGTERRNRNTVKRRVFLLLRPLSRRIPSRVAICNTPTVAGALMGGVAQNGGQNGKPAQQGRGERRGKASGNGTDTGSDRKNRRGQTSFRRSGKRSK